MKLIDSHFHSLMVIEKGNSLDEAVASIYGGIDIGTEYDDLKKRSEVIDKYPHIKKSAAMGPWETQNTSIEELDRRFEILKKYIDIYKPLFIGEFGLDNYCGYGPEDVQEYLMKKHMALAASLKKKVLIHSRDADSQMVKLLPQFSGVNGIIHCFSGSIDVLNTALELGYYISYAGNVTFKANNALRETLKLVPKNRLLLETDAPYLSPIPVRGTPNTPKNMLHIYSCVAQYLGKPVEQLAEEVYNNFNEFCRPLS